MAGIKERYEIVLVPRQYEYLTEMARVHGLPDAAKAVRCLVDHAIANPDLEREIFEEQRCRDC